MINLRERIIPVIDLRLRQGLEQEEYNEGTSITVIELSTQNEILVSGLTGDTE